MDVRTLQGGEPPPVMGVYFHFSYNTKNPCLYAGVLKVRDIALRDDVLYFDARAHGRSDTSGLNVGAFQAAWFL